ncbi:hypothetical protein ABK040_011601 [Willaertia magna]
MYPRNTYSSSSSGSEDELIIHNTNNITNNTINNTNNKGVNLYRRRNNKSQNSAKIAKSSTTKTPGKKKVKINIPTSDIIRVMMLPQVIAAQKLDVSLSTLKRRFYELGIGRWPGLQQIETNSATLPQNKASLSFILNDMNSETTQLDPVSLSILSFSFKQNVEKL